jgi:hypothetical protein
MNPNELLPFEFGGFINSLIEIDGIGEIKCLIRIVLLGFFEFTLSGNFEGFLSSNTLMGDFYSKFVKFLFLEKVLFKFKIRSISIDNNVVSFDIFTNFSFKIFTFPTMC